MFKNEYSNQIKHFEYDGFFLNQNIYPAVRLAMFIII